MTEYNDEVNYNLSIPDDEPLNKELFEISNNSQVKLNQLQAKVKKLSTFPYEVYSTEGWGTEQTFSLSATGLRGVLLYNVNAERILEFVKNNLEGPLV